MSRPPVPPFSRETAIQKWLFDAEDDMVERHARVSGAPINGADGLFRRSQGRWPEDDHGLIELGL